MMTSLVDSARRLPRLVQAYSRWHLPIVLGFLFLLNVWICHELFYREFTAQIGSIESSYMSIPRWELAHPGQRWFPVWFEGMPVIQAYSPGLPALIRWLVTITDWTVQHSYHFLVASTYSLSALSLAALLYFGSRNAWVAGLGGLLCSTYSATCILSRNIRADDGGRLVGRRLIILLRYGEGPHTTAVALIPIVILVLHQAIIERRRWALLAAPFLVAAMPIVNWPGTVGLSLALAAYCFANLKVLVKPARLIALVACLVTGYLLASPWIPPSLIGLIQRNAQLSDDTMLGPQKLLTLGSLVAALFAGHLIFEKLRFTPWLRFWIYFVALAGVISIGHEWFGWRLLPQSNRFELEFDVAASGLAAWIGIALLARLRRSVRIAAAVCLLAVCVLGGKNARRYFRAEDKPLDITQTIEYQMSKWFDREAHGHRVFAPGNISLWMNMFTDTPQMQGCCDPGVPVQTHRIAGYVIYTGQNAGPDDAKISIAWLKAYGVDMIGVSGPKSTEHFHPFWHAGKFEGLLPVLWRNGDNAVYGLSRVHPVLAHVVTPDVVVSRQPENGLRIEEVQRYVDQIEAPGAPDASFSWSSDEHAVIDAQSAPGKLVSVQITYAPGWRATVDGRVVPTRADALGLMIIDPRCSGTCHIKLDWTETRERYFARIAQILAVLGWCAGLLFLFRNRRQSAAA